MTVERLAIETDIIEYLTTSHTDASPVVLLAPGGFGKTTIARRIAGSTVVRNAYPQGVFWLQVNAEVNDALLAQKANDIVALLTGIRPSLQDVDLATQNLRLILEDKFVLLILDDVWDARVLELFSGSDNVSRLITTRDVQVAPVHAHIVSVPYMTSAESLAVLVDGLSPNEIVMAAFEKVADLASGWPVLLKLLNGRLVGDVRGRIPLDQAVGDTLRLLTSEGITPFVDLDIGQAGGIASIVTASIARLPPEIAERYIALTAFSMSKEIPSDVLSASWGIGSNEVDRTCRWLLRVSLIQAYTRKANGQSTILMHDIVWQVLRAVYEPSREDIQRALVSSWRSRFGDGSQKWWRQLPPIAYYWENLTWHLSECDDWHEVREATSDLVFLAIQSSICGRLTTQLELRRARALMPEMDAFSRIFESQGHVLDALNSASDRQATMATWVPTGETPPAPRIRLITGIPWDSGVTATASVEDAFLRGGVLACKSLRDTEYGMMLGCTDNSVLIWHTDQPELMTRMVGHGDWVRACSLSPAGDTGASASDDGTVRTWDLTTGAEGHVLRGHLASVRSCCFVRGGSELASGSEDHTVRFWNVETGELLSVLRGDGGAIRACAASDEGSWIAYGSDDGLVRIRDLNGTETRILRGHVGSIRAVAVTPSGDLIASGGDDGELRIWDSLSGRCIHTLVGHRRPIRDCAFSSSGDRLISAGGDDRSLRVWDTTSGAAIGIVENLPGWLMSCSFIDGDAAIAVGSIDARVRIYGSDQLLPRSEIRGRPTTIWVCKSMPNLPLVALGGVDGSVRLVGLGSTSDREIGQHQAIVRDLASDATGLIIASASDDGEIKIWNIDEGGEPKVLRGHSDGVRSIQLSADGHTGLSAGQDGTAILWDVMREEEIRRFNGHGAPVTAATFWDSRHVVSSSADGTVRVWDLTDSSSSTIEVMSPVTTLLIHNGPQGRAIVGTERGTLHSIDLISGSVEETVEAHQQWVTSVTYIPETGVLVSVSDDRTLRAWTLGGGIAPLCALAVQQPLYSVSWSAPRGSLVACGAGGLYEVDIDV